MKPEEITKLKMKSSFDDGVNDWVVPPFVLRSKEVALPSLSIKKQARDFMENQKDERDMVLEGESSGDGSCASKGGSSSYLAKYEAAQLSSS